MTQQTPSNATTVREMPEQRPAPITVRITPNDKSSPVGKLADADLYFHDGPLAGLRLLGFAIWESRDGIRRNVTFPSRQYSVNGERRSYALLRPAEDVKAQDHIRDLILSAYARHEAEQEQQRIEQAAAQRQTPTTPAGTQVPPDFAF